jgi:hypothetical protein
MSDRLGDGQAPPVRQARSRLAGVRRSRWQRGGTARDAAAKLHRHASHASLVAPDPEMGDDIRQQHDVVSGPRTGLVTDQFTRNELIESHGAELRGRARLGRARLGRARLGWARLGRARLGRARLGRARLGRARLGRARLGRARLGRVLSRFVVHRGCLVSDRHRGLHGERHAREHHRV